MFQVAVFAGLVLTAGRVCLVSRGATMPLLFAVLFEADAAYETMTLRFSPTAALAALTAIAFCGLAWAMDRLSSGA